MYPRFLSCILEPLMNNEFFLSQGKVMFLFLRLLFMFLALLFRASFLCIMLYNEYFPKESSPANNDFYHHAKIRKIWWAISKKKADREINNQTDKHPDHDETIWPAAVSRSQMKNQQWSFAGMGIAVSKTSCTENRENCKQST